MKILLTRFGWPTVILLILVCYFVLNMWPAPVNELSVQDISVLEKIYGLDFPKSTRIVQTYSWNRLVSLWCRVDFNEADLQEFVGKKYFHDFSKVYEDFDEEEAIDSMIREQDDPNYVFPSRTEILILVHRRLRDRVVRPGFFMDLKEVKWWDITEEDVYLAYVSELREDTQYVEIGGKANIVCIVSKPKKGLVSCYLILSGAERFPWYGLTESKKFPKRNAN